MSLALNVSVLAALLPAVWFSTRGRSPTSALFGAAVGLAFVASALWSASLVGEAWRSGLGPALWVSITATIAVYTVGASVSRVMGRLAALLFPYLLVLAAIATALGPGEIVSGPDGGEIWFLLHIAVSVLTYALATMAAVAGLAVFLQERALKSKRQGWASAVLPAMMPTERLQFQLLAAAEIVLGLGLASGVAIGITAGEGVPALDHKTVLSVGAFAVIGVLLAAHARAGVRGRTAARTVLVAYLLLTLAYPGVKFVSEVLLGR